MSALLSTYGTCGGVETKVGLAVRSRALGAERCDVLVATGGRNLTCEGEE